MKGNRPLGLTVIGGKGSKYGDIGIFIRDILVDGAAHRCEFRTIFISITDFAMLTGMVVLRFTMNY